MDREEYEASFSDNDRVHFPDLRRTLSELGVPIEYADDVYPLPERIP